MWKQRRLPFPTAVTETSSRSSAVRETHAIIAFGSVQGAVWLSITKSPHSEHRFPAPSSRLCQNCSRHWRGTRSLPSPSCPQTMPGCPPKGLGWWWWCSLGEKNSHYDDDDVQLHVLGCRVDILGTNCDQCVCVAQCSFTSTETIMLIRTGGPGRPPRLSHSSWTLRPSGTHVNMKRVRHGLKKSSVSIETILFLYMLA